MPLQFLPFLSAFKGFCMDILSQLLTVALSSSSENKLLIVKWGESMHMWLWLLPSHLLHHDLICLISIITRWSCKDRSYPLWQTSQHHLCQHWSTCNLQSCERDIQTHSQSRFEIPSGEANWRSDESYWSWNQVNFLSLSLKSVNIIIPEVPHSFFNLSYSRSYSLLWRFWWCVAYISGYPLTKFSSSK